MMLCLSRRGYKKVTRRCSTRRSKLVRQACPAEQLIAPQRALSSPQLTTKRNTYKQTPRANRTGYERTLGQHTGGSVNRSFKISEL